MNNSNIAFARPDITKLERQAVDRVLRSGWLTAGPEVQAFEDEFAEYTGASHAIAVNSCTSALHLALLGAHVQAEDAVLVPTITFMATAEAVMYTGALPLLIDIDPADYMWSPEILSSWIEQECETREAYLYHKKSGRRIRAALPVHIGGQPCDLLAIHTLLAPYQISIIDDAAHAFGSSMNDLNIGSDSLPQQMSCFSFYATKNITTGEGGMLTLQDAEFAEQIRYKRLHGIKGQVFGRQRWHYDVVTRGYKYNMTDMAAAMGRIQMQRSVGMYARRLKIFKYYNEYFTKLEKIRLTRQTQFQSSHHLYMIHLGSADKRDQFVNLMFEQGIGVSLHFIPLYRHSFWQSEYGDLATNYTGTEQAYNGMVSLPIYSAMSDGEIERVAKTVSTICNNL